MNLSKLAIKRLQKELKNTPPIGLSLAPLEDDLSQWHGNIKIMDGAYEGVNFHVFIEVPENYPNKAPSAYFKSFIAYQNGATTNVDGKGTSICLDLLGNFANVHTEWGNTASGWSPGNSLQTVLIQLQGVLNDMLSSSSVAKTKQSAQELKCKCGHDGSKESLYYPPLSMEPTAPPHKNDNNNSNSETKESLEETCARLKEENARLKIKADKYDELHALFVKLNGGVLEGDDVTEEAAKPAVAKEAPKPKLEHLVCYVSGLSAADEEDKEIFGFGVGVNDKNGSLSTSGELLSKSAYDGGVRRSSQNEKIDFFLPIYISQNHWNLAKDVFRKSIADMYKAMVGKQRNAKKEQQVEIQALLILCSLMNNACVATSSANGKAHDNFINSYFCLLRILKWLVGAFPSVGKFATTQVGNFQKGNRNKNSVPNLGEFLVLLHASSIKWEDIRIGFVEEVDARNVRWFKNSALQNQGNVKNRYQLTFGETATSRQIVCFQVRFLDVSTTTDIQAFVDGAAPENIMKELKEIHAKVKAHKDWNDYAKWVGLPAVSVEQRTKELESAVALSLEEKYHGGGGGNNRNNNNNRRNKRY